MEKQRYFYNHKSQAAKSTGLVGSNLWEWRLHPSQQRGLNVDRELLDRVKSLKLRFYGHMTRKYESLEKEIIQGCVPGYRNRGWQRRRWDRWHSWMDWDEDQWSCYSSGRFWSLERDTMRRQPFLWRKAVNNDNDYHCRHHHYLSTVHGCQLSVVEFFLSLLFVPGMFCHAMSHPHHLSKFSVAAWAPTFSGVAQSVPQFTDWICTYLSNSWTAEIHLIAAWTN